MSAPGSETMLAPLRPFMVDAAVSEIMVNRPKEVFVERCGRMERTVVEALSALHLKRLFAFIANENGRLLDGLNPLLSGNLADGSRVQLVVPPASQNYTLSIRRQSIKSLTLDDYQQSDFYAQATPFHASIGAGSLLSDADARLLALYNQGDWSAFVRLAVETKKNIVISGETSSGKTTYLNACAAFIPLEARIITLEDSFEINAPHANQVNLRVDKKLESQKTGLCMQDLVQCALRLRPDRIIMGEIRGAEALDFISACSTGHDGTLSTIHAPNPRVALMRMVQMVKRNGGSIAAGDIKRMLHEVVDIILQLTPVDGRPNLQTIYYKHALEPTGCA